MGIHSGFSMLNIGYKRQSSSVTFLRAPSITSRSQDILKLFPAKRFLARGNIGKCAP